MTDIAKHDTNLAVESSIQREGLCFCDAEEAPFQVYGVFKENGLFRRMPEAIASKISEGVSSHSTRSAGGRVRFVTSSPYVAIKTEYIPHKTSCHMAVTGSAGFDLYAEYDDRVWYKGTFVPPYDVEDGYESVLDLGAEALRIITINFPLYSSVKKLYIGLKEGSVLEPAPGYRIEKPVVYYGSSITQGGCASKPGSTYQSILSFRYNCDYINLGFNGSARGEAEMAEYIRSLDMSAFVMDYDYNAPTPEHLQATHSRMYEIVREAHPKLPIIILQKPRLAATLPEAGIWRSAIIRDTYLKARERGDNVYFISGDELMALVGDNGTVDNAHPTDSGFYSMAMAISKVFDKIFE